MASRKKLPSKLDMEKLYDQLMKGYCPRCGAESRVTDPHPEATEGCGESVVYECPECGEFRIDEKGGEWFVSGTDIPYIMYGKSNAATLLHDFDPSSYDDEKEMYVEWTNRLCDCADEYLGIGDYKNMDKHLAKAVEVAIESMRKGHVDNFIYFSCFAFYLEAMVDSDTPKEDIVRTIREIESVVKHFEDPRKVATMDVLSNAYAVHGIEAGEEAVKAYEDVSTRDPVVDDRFLAFDHLLYWQLVTVLATRLHRLDDVPPLMARVVESLKTVLDKDGYSLEFIEQFFVFVMSIGDSIRDDSFDDLIEPLFSILDEDDPFYGIFKDGLMMTRYEHRLFNGRKPYDRLNDVNTLIDRYGDPPDGYAASVLAKLYAHRALEAEDFDDAIADMEASVDLMIKFKLTQPLYNALKMEVAEKYLDLIGDDKKLQKKVWFKLKKIGVTKDSLKSWKRSADRPGE